MNREELLVLLGSKYACQESLEWVKSLEPELTAEQAWEKCTRGDWMLWIAASLRVDRRVVTLAACACARTALEYVPEGEVRPLRCIETTEAWCRDEATLDDVRVVRRAAYAAAAAAAAAYDAADAAYAAADAAAAAAAYAAADAADAAADAADAADAARLEALAGHACLVRDIIPWSTIAAAAEPS